MSALYFDTSAIVPAFVPESASEAIHSLLEARGAEAVTISSWVLTEFSSAVTLKLRMGTIELQHHAAVLKA